MAHGLISAYITRMRHLGGIAGAELSLVAEGSASKTSKSSISADLLDSQVRLVVMEEGTARLESHAPPDGSEQTMVLAPSPGEGPLALSLRAIRRMLALEQSRRSIRLMVMILAHRFDREAMNARLLLARSLMAHAAPREGGSVLLLCADDERRPGFRTGLVRLVEALMAQPGSDALAIRMRFASGAQRLRQARPDEKKRISQRFFSVALGDPSRRVHG
jgi:hypothetical protein